MPHTHSYLAQRKSKCNKKPHHHVKLSNELKQDIQMWLRFLFNFNGARLIHENECLSSDSIELLTDSTGNPDLGCGAYCQGHWIYWSWPNDWEISVFKNVIFRVSAYTSGNLFVG